MLASLCSIKMQRLTHSEEAPIQAAKLQVHHAPYCIANADAHPKVAKIAIQEAVSLVPLCEPKAHMWLCRLDASILHARPF